MQHRNHSLSPILRSRGHLTLATAEDAPVLAPDVSRKLRDSFSRGARHGLLQLCAEEVATALPPVFGYWREFGVRYATAVCTLPDAEELGPQAHAGVPSIDVRAKSGARIEYMLSYDTQTKEAAMPTVRTSFYLAQETQARLRLAARQLGRSQTELVNQALENFLRGQRSAELRSIGAGKDGAMGAAEVKRWARERMARGAVPVPPKGRR